MMKKRFWLNIIAATCIFTQAVASIPHHHHCIDNSPCLGSFHCTAECRDIPDEHGCMEEGTFPCSEEAVTHTFEDRCDSTPENDCCHTVKGGHSHNGGDPECILEQFDFFYQQDDGNIFPAAAVIFIDIEILAAGSTGGKMPDYYFSPSGARRRPSVKPFHTEYICSALPVRAPSFTA